MKKVFFPVASSALGSIMSSNKYKSDERNPYNNDNTPLEDSPHSDIWEIIRPEINKYKSMLFWFQVRSGML